MKYPFLAAVLCCSLQAAAQFFSPGDYPRDYFRDPLDIPIKLAANFGELRPNHYHMGLDIRTQARENLSVFAAADGYIARVSVEPGGFGQAIYINHPNGYTTVYGHLNQFFPALAAYVHEQQYRRQSWSLALQLPPNLFPVKKGDFIAYSGNTGGSQGPHLHFEIRRTAGDVNQNPLLFGLPVPDNTPPTLQRLAWYDRNKGIYEQSPHILPIRHDATGWSPAPALLVVPTTRISFALSAFDTQSGSKNPNGIYEADLFVDEQPVIAFQMNNISYDNTRNINAHIDYKTRHSGGPFLQQLFFLSGYPLPSIYAAPAGRPGDGVVRLDDGRVHAIRIVVKDTYANTSQLRFRVQYRPGASIPHNPGAPTTIPPLANARVPGPPAASPHTPPNAASAGAPQNPGKKFYVGMVDGIEAPDYAFFLGEKSLYDSATIAVSTTGYPGSGLSLPGGVSAVEAIGSPAIPLLDPVLVRLRPLTTTADSLPHAPRMPASADRIIMVRIDGASRDVQKPEWQGDWASARWREFGQFQLVVDKQPPVITLPGIAEGADLSRAEKIIVSVKDNFPGIRNFTAVLDPPASGPGGQWLCFTNDKGLAYIYHFDEHCPAGRHVLRITAQDIAGNTTVREVSFTR